MVVFWFAIHLENLELASILVENEQSVKELVAMIYYKDYMRVDEGSSNNPQGLNTASLGVNSSKVPSSRKPPKHNSEYDDEVGSSQDFSEFDSQNSIKVLSNS